MALGCVDSGLGSKQCSVPWRNSCQSTSYERKWTIPKALGCAEVQPSLCSAAGSPCSQAKQFAANSVPGLATP